jgi:regulatory protein
LAAQDLLSDARYIDSRLRTRAPRLGARRLAAELAQHGLKPEGETWEAVQATEAERALALLQRRFGEDPPTDLKEKARRLRFLLSRGFAPGLAAKLVEGKAA